MVQESTEDDRARMRQANEMRDTDPARSFQEYRVLAEKGLPYAMLGLAFNYMKGLGTPVDCAQAEVWCRRAYDTGSGNTKAMATYFLGWCYLKLNNYPKALEILSAGADMNYGPSIYRLAQMYRGGLGVEKQPDKIRVLNERAAALGHLLAKRDLALQLMSGRFGVGNIFKGFVLLLRFAKEAIIDLTSGMKGLKDGRVWW